MDSGYLRNPKRWSDSGCIFKIEPAGFADGLDGGVRERTENDSKVFGPNIRKDRIAIKGVGKSVRGRAVKKTSITAPE